MRSQNLTGNLVSQIAIKGNSSKISSKNDHEWIMPSSLMTEKTLVADVELLEEGTWGSLLI